MNMLLIASQELSKLLATRRGWIAVVCFGLMWAFGVVGIIKLIADKLRETQLEDVASDSLERFGISGFGEWPAPELALYWMIALYLLPLFALVISADQIASDKTRRTLRYLTLRASRNQIFFGRFIGQCVIQLLVILLSAGSVFALIAWQAPEQLTASVLRLPMLLVNLMLVMLPYVALMAFASVVAKSARQATILAIIGWILASILIAVVQNKFGPFNWLDWVVPGSQITSLLSLEGWDTMQLAHIPIAHTVALLLLGWWSMRRIAL